MAAYVKIVPAKDWNNIKEYFDGNEGCILVPEDVLKELSREEQDQIREMDQELMEYDFGGEADIFLDIAQSTQSYCLQSVLAHKNELTMGGI